VKIAATERNPQPMTDYYPLIARAVEVLDRSTGEARRALYERARNALVAQLRSNQPALFEAQITKERLALEEAIRKVEAEATRKSHNESQAEQQAVSRAATSRAPTPEAVPQFRRAFEAPRRDRNNPPPTDMPRAGWTVPSARERLLSSRSSLKKRGVKDFGDVVGEVGAATAKATQTAVSPASGFEPEPAVRADVEILERRMTVTWSLRRNTDKALAASHTIEITFNLPADFPGGGIANVSGILMKQAEQARGTPLSGLAVKVTNGFFLIGLSAVDTDVRHNVQLLKERSWFDIPIVYANGGRATLAMEKGAPGDHAFAEIFREKK
jgi:hypothetical protein